MTHVAIIGAGPAGLCAAACLAEYGVPYTLLDRGDALAALRTIDPEIRLLTPSAMSRLPGMELPGDYPTFGVLVAAIDAWRAARGIVVTRGEVAAVERGFTVRGTRDLAATHVINATGIIGSPQLPDPLPRGRWMHSRDVRSADLAAARRLVVVGAGMSAAETLERWLEVRADGSQAWLATRKPVRAVPSRIAGIDIHWLTWLPEHARGRLFGRRLAPERDLIIGRSVVRALRDGRIQRATGDIAADLTVLATGFRYRTDHLGELVERDRDGWPLVDRHAQSTRTPDLYLLGVRFGRSIASPYLRGIVRDARHVAARIASRGQVR